LNYTKLNGDDSPKDYNLEFIAVLRDDIWPMVGKFTIFVSQAPFHKEYRRVYAD